MKKVIITQNNETSRFEATDIDGVVHYTAAKKADLKTSLKRSKKHEFEIVEAFETVEPVKEVAKPAKEDKPKTVKPAKEDKPKTVKPAKSKKASYEDCKQHIITNFTDADLHSKADKIANFCKKFNLTLNKSGRNLTFEKTLTKMIDDGIVEYAPTENCVAGAKYKKLKFQYTEQHKAFMSPDEDEL